MPVLVCVLATCAAAQVSPSLYSGMRWRMIGPFRGGRVLAVSGVPGRRDLYYFGAVAGGVWKSANSARTWEPLFDSQPIASIGALAVAESDPNVLYAGSGEADMRSDVTFGNGMYKSNDGGRSWQHIGLDDSRHIGRVSIDPRDANVVLVAALGHAYGPNAERGVFRTSDGGRTWQKVLYKDENTGAIDLARDPANPDVVYASLWNARRPPWSTYPPTQGPGSGLYKSADGGKTWQQLTGHGLPGGQWGRTGLAAGKNHVVYALIEAGENGGLFRSNDAGASWTRVGTDKRIRERSWYFSGVTVDPNNPDVVYLPNVALLRSTDGGHTFTALKGNPGGDDYHTLWIDPADSQRMIMGCDQGTLVSVDGGKSWSSWFNQPTAQFYHVTTDNQFPYWVYGAQQDSGTVATASASDYGSITYRDWLSVGAGEAGTIVPDPSDPNIVIGGDTYGRLFRFDKRTGQSQDISPSPVALFDPQNAISTHDLRFTWTSPVVFSPQDPHTMYMGSQYVLESRDQGMSWNRISPDLTGCSAPAVPRPPSAGNEPVSVNNAAARCYGVVYALAPSPVTAGVLWAGADTGLIQLTRDGGKTWTNVTPPEVKDWSKISIIDASPFDAGAAYVAVDRHRLDDPAPYIYRTRDFGRTWQKIAAGIPAGSYVRSVRQDPRRKELLYAATETGVYVSFDDGEHWQSLQLNLPVVPVHDLVVHGDDLVIASHGRSFWILDDVTPLRQTATAAGAQGPHLYQPQTAIRVRHDMNRDTPLPPETPMGENPPSGAVLDYYLPSAVQGEVTLEVLDGSGQAVRRFSSSDKPQLPKADTLAFSYDWVRPPQPLGTTAGEHRFVWDLRYPSPPAVEHSYDISAVWTSGVPEYPRGPLALPGQYTVRLTAGGATLSQPLTIKLDPRLTVSESDLRRQVEFELQVSAALREDYDAVQQAKALSKRANLSAETRRKLASITGIVPEGAPPASGINLTSLNGTLASLIAVVDTADHAPTQQAQEAFAQARKELDKLLQEWKQWNATN